MIEPSLNKGIEFNNSGFEQVKDLYQERKKDYEKNHIENVPDKEIVKEVVDGIFDEELNKKAVPETNINVSNFSVFDNTNDDEQRRAESVLNDLVKIAFEKNINTAISTSFKTSNAYLIDRFHDLIVDKFYEELVKEKKLKNN